MARRALGIALAFFLGVTSPLSAQLRSEIVVEGLQSPVAVLTDSTHPSTFLIVEQRGVIRVAQEGRLLNDAFLDLRDHVSTGGERGLLGLALAPDYAESGRLFVNFTNRDGDTVIARFVRDAENPLRADPSTRLDLQWPDGRRVIDQPFSNHNGGHLLFGPDGYLYIGLGDGGSAGDPMNHAQRGDSLLGKMLRLDVNVPDDDRRGYRVPEDNPFLGDAPVRALGEIWAFGLRNPWRYTFDDWTGAMLIADVGQNSREEINFEPRGAGGGNYGWRLREGRQPFADRGEPAYRPLIEPIHDYGRSMGASITGGFVYRGSALDPAFEGRYFYADFVSGRVFSIGLHLDDDGEAHAADEREHTSQLGGREVLGGISSFGQDEAGELLLLNHSAGRVVRIVPDFGIVPREVSVAGNAESGRVHLTWHSTSGEVEPVEYVVERVRDGRVVDRTIVERDAVTLDAEPGDCFRVRGRARNGAAGPASEPVCAPQP